MPDKIDELFEKNIHNLSEPALEKEAACKKENPIIKKIKMKKKASPDEEYLRWMIEKADEDVVKEAKAVNVGKARKTVNELFDLAAEASTDELIKKVVKKERADQLKGAAKGIAATGVLGGAGYAGYKLKGSGVKDPDDYYKQAAYQPAEENLDLLSKLRQKMNNVS